MPAPLSIDLRQRIIAAYEAKEGSQRQLAERFKVSLSFIRDLRRHHRQTGTVQPKPPGGGAVAKLGKEQSGVQAQAQRQKKTLIAAQQETQRVKDLRFAYRLWSFTIDPRNLVFIDETGIHLALTRL
jgi:transposase